MVEEMPMTRPDVRRLSLRRLVPLALIVLGAGVGVALIGDRLSLESLRANHQALMAWRDGHYGLAAVSYVALYVLVVALSLPGALVMTLAGGFLFGALVGTGLSVVAATAGATLIFVAAKHGLGDALHARLRARGGKRIGKLERGLRENAFAFLLTARLVPVFPFFVLNLAPAFLGVRLGTFVAATFIGIIPGTAVYSWVGAGLGRIFAMGGTPDLGLIFQPSILGPLLALAALSALPILLRVLGKRRPQ